MLLNCDSLSVHACSVRTVFVYISFLPVAMRVMTSRSYGPQPPCLRLCSQTFVLVYIIPETLFISRVTVRICSLFAQTSERCYFPSSHPQFSFILELFIITRSRCINIFYQRPRHSYKLSSQRLKIRETKSGSVFDDQVRIGAHIYPRLTRHASRPSV